MGCFLACFGGEKGQKQRRRSRKSLPRDRAKESYQALRTSPSPKEVAEKLANVSIPELRENQEQGSFGGCRKKVTFDLNVKTYEDPIIHEESQCPLHEEEGETKEGTETEGESEGKASASLGVYPVNHRYQDCDGSDDEDVIDDSDDDDFDFEEEEDEDDGIVGAEEESYESFFSLPLESEKQGNCPEVSSPVPISIPAKAIARDRSEYVHSVLNPVQNLSQWKEAKVRGLPLKNPDKENNGSVLDKENIKLESESKMIVFSPDPIFKTNNGSLLDKENVKLESESKMIVFSPDPIFKTNKPQNVSDTYQPSNSTKQEISVDASLSTWLVSPQNSKVVERPQGSSSSVRSISSVNREERPILGALTVDDIKLSSVTSSPRRSPSRSPDDIPILGIVGSYWKSEAKNDDTKGIPNTTSKYREDRRVNWHSTPFEERLERALNKGTEEEACS